MTTTDPRQQLHYIITHYGRSICDDPKRCEALLKDLCPQHKREVFLLVAALREGIAKELLTPNQLLPIETVISRLSQKLHDELGFEIGLAQWAVESWALALGVKFNSVVIVPSADKGKAGMGSPQVATPIMPVDHAAAFEQIKQQKVKAVVDKTQIEELKRWQKIGSQGEKLPINASQWAAASDKNTKLMWAINPSKTADFPNPKEKMTWDDAMAWPDYVNQYGWCGYKDWRFPTINELETLLAKEKQGDLFICADIFMDINTKYYWVWSSSHGAYGRYDAWIVDFGNGNYYNYDGKDNNNYVRLVRSSQ